MLSKTFAMVGRHDDQGGVVNVVVPQILEDPAECIIGVGDLSIVGITNQGAKTRRGVVRQVRIVQMNPGEKWFGCGVGLGRQPAKSVHDHFLCAAPQFDQVKHKQIIPAYFPAQRARIRVEAAVQPAPGVQDVGAHKRRRRITVLFQDGGQRGWGFPQRVAQVVANAVDCRVSARHD